MKTFFRSWLDTSLVVLFAIGMCWGWLSHAAMSASLDPANLRVLPIVAVAQTDFDLKLANSSQNAHYRANGDWIGRLILPSQDEIGRSNLSDWVWVEIAHAPARDRALIGKTLPLTWQARSRIEADARQVTTDIQFTAGTIASAQQGNIHPHRLNGRSAVGALQSLAGARPGDDLLVRLAGAKIAVENDAQQPMLTIDREPTQITGTWRGLVKILGTDTSQETTCAGSKLCGNEYVRVQHYNLNSDRFDGEIERIKMPHLPAKTSGLLPSTIRDLDRSPAGDRGWYIYGERDVAGVFTVAAIQPRSLLTLTPQREITNADAKLDYLDRQHWEHTSQHRGKLSQVKFVGTSPPQPEKLGDRSLLIHLFGGIGGKTGDKPGLWQTVTGHFAYGMATVVRDEFTGELRWELEYNQVYAHNRDGIISGKQDWATYMGHRQRGWLATRPVADVLISYPPVTEDYDFGGYKLSPLSELQRQLNIAGARYRTGDGTGNASVTPATSCVQDANQALYLTIRALNRQVELQPQIQAWIASHPHHPQTLRFQQLQSLGTELATTLAPLGIVRRDWAQNAAKLAGIGAETGFTSSSNPIAGLMTWRTMLPRGAQDGIAKIFNRHGATMWFLNTFQVGGVNPDIFPIAPTILFGQVPLLSTLVIRIWAGIVTLPTLTEWLLVFSLLVIYAVIAVTIGFKSRFLTFAPTGIKLPSQIRSLIHLFWLPAFVEEFIFRLLLMPHPIETATSGNIYLWSILSLSLFIIYHPANALTFYQLGNPTFMDWRFLTLAGLLGIVCTIAYVITGSIWPSVIVHWLVVVTWIELFGGKQLLEPNSLSC